LSTVPFESLLEGDEKGCCASLYQAAPVRWLLDGRLHPGGEALTLRTADLAGIEPGARVLDVASGTGTSALVLARERGADVTGVELGAGAVAEAGERAHREGLAHQVRFVEGDAEALPVAGGSFDAVLCECSLCLFADKERALAEIVRVLRPGGALALSDVVAETAALPAPLRTAAARVACVADALSEGTLLELLRTGGLEPAGCERHDAELAAMVDRVEARLRVARMLAVPALEPFREDLAAAKELAGLAKQSVARGQLGYVAVAARRPSEP